MVMGVGGGMVRETQTPLDKLELQTVETCEIRMEPSLLYCDLKDRAGKDSPFTVQLPRQTPDAPTQPPTPLLFWFTFVWPELKQEGTGQNNGVKVFVKDGLCTRCHWKGKAEILWWCYKIAEADQCINPYDCISEPFLSDVCSQTIHFQSNYLQLLFQPSLMKIGNY